MRCSALVAVALIAGACGSDDGSVPMGSTDTDTDTLTTFGPTTDPASTSSEPSEPPADDDDTLGTTLDSDSLSGTGSTTAATEGSTGCLDGAAGCACNEAEPLCEGELECVRDVCVEPLCPDKEFEDNDAFNDAAVLGELDDSDPPQMLTSALSGTDDIDWFRYTCNDTIVDDLDPTLQSDTDGPMRVCFFLECVIGGKPLFDCPAGTTPELAPIGFIPGCCVDDASTINLSDYNCPDDSDDSVVVHIKAEMAADDACIGYSMTYNC